MNINDPIQGNSTGFCHSGCLASSLPPAREGSTAQHLLLPGGLSSWPAPALHKHEALGDSREKTASLASPSAVTQSQQLWLHPERRGWSQCPSHAVFTVAGAQGHRSSALNSKADKKCQTQAGKVHLEVAQGTTPFQAWLELPILYPVVCARTLFSPA